MRIQNKLFLFLFGYSLTLVTILVLLMQWSIGKGMVEYVVAKEIETLKPVVSSLIEEYQINDDWDGIYGEQKKFRQLISKQMQNSGFEPPELKRRPDHLKYKEDDRYPSKGLRSESTDRQRSSFNDLPPKRPPPHKGRNSFSEGKRPPPPKGAAHYAVLDINGSMIVGHISDQLEYTRTPIKIEDEIIGYFAVSKRNKLTDEYELNFVEQQQHYLWVIAVAVMLLVAFGTFPLARHVVEPIKSIAKGMHKLTQGNFQHPVQINRKDELGDLSDDYNELSNTLADNEASRKRWLANTSHELRTPVAILRGELEAMLDGVRPINIENISSATDEIKHLQRLIDDLNQLTSAEIGGMSFYMESGSLEQFMAEELEKYRGYLSDSGINLTLLLTRQSINFNYDRTRLSQLFENLINNCIKYAEATELSITLQLKQIGLNGESIEISFEDNGVGVDETHRALLFEHLYRVEDSRNRETGGSGLGLSICRHIVEAHNGTIVAEESALGGLKIKVTCTLH